MSNKFQECGKTTTGKSTVDCTTCLASQRCLASCHSKTLILIIGFLLLVSLSYSQSLTFMTYNIRYDNPNDGENSWDNRKQDLANQLKFYEPDILGIQEGLHHQVLFLDSCLEDYSWFGVGRDDGKTLGEYCSIFYNNADFELLDGNTFWLSETPYEVSVGWDASMERICTWALFKDKSTRQLFYVFNTHFDHIGKLAQENSALLILDKIEEINKDSLPIVIMGDFNMEPSEKGIQSLSTKMNDSKNSATVVSFGPSATYNGFNFEEIPAKRIDYIFTSKEIVVKKYAVLTDSKQGRYFSDHFAVLVEINL